MLRFPGDAPIAAGNRSAEDHRDWLADFLEAFENSQFALAQVWGGDEGCVKAGAAYLDDFKAEATGTPSMVITVSGGVAIVGGKPTWIRETANLSFTAPTGNPRIDTIQVSAATRTITAKAGTEAAAPVAPDPDAEAVALWHVYHRVGETCIQNSDDSTNGYLNDAREWLASAILISEMGDLDDVDLAGLADGDILVYRTASGKFEAEAAPSGGGASSLSDLSDVNLAGLADGDILVYNGTSGDFEPGAVTFPDTNEPMVLTAQGLTPAATGGCAAPAVTETSTNKLPYWAAAFDGGTNEVGWFCNIALPVNYKAASTLTIRPMWTAAAGTAGQTAIFKIAARAFGDDDALDAAFSSNVATVEDALIAAGDVHIGPATELTVNGSPAANKLLAFRVERDAATDTLTGDVGFLGLLVTYTGAQ